MEPSDDETSEEEVEEEKGKDHSKLSWYPRGIYYFEGRVADYA